MSLESKPPADDQPIPHDFAKPPTTPPPSPKPNRTRPVSGRQLALVSAIVLVILLIAYILPARAAARQFSDRLSQAQSYRLTGNLTLKGSAFLAVLNSNLNITGSVAKHGTSDQLSYQGLFGDRTYDGHLVVDKGNLYSQMTGEDLPFISYNQGIAHYHITPKDWYQIKLDNSIYKYYCETKPDSKYPSPLVWYQALRQIKLQPSPLVIYGQKIDGHTTTHLRGSLSSKSLASAWENINNSLPNGCQIELLIEDLSSLDVNYDLYTSKDYDQLQFHINDKELGVSGTLKLVFDQYNQQAAATPPSQVISLESIFSGRAAIQSRDFRRRQDIDALKKAIDAYYAANRKTLPSRLSKLVPKYIATVPKDPKGGDYSYSISKKTYTLSATLEDAGQSYSVTGP